MTPLWRWRWLRTYICNLKRSNYGRTSTRVVAMQLHQRSHVYLLHELNTIHIGTNNSNHKNNILSCTYIHRDSIRFHWKHMPRQRRRRRDTAEIIWSAEQSGHGFFVGTRGTQCTYQPESCSILAHYYYYGAPRSIYCDCEKATTQRQMVFGMDNALLSSIYGMSSGVRSLFLLPPSSRKGSLHGQISCGYTHHEVVPWLGT